MKKLQRLSQRVLQPEPPRPCSPALRADKVFVSAATRCGSLRFIIAFVLACIFTISVMLSFNSVYAKEQLAAPGFQLTDLNRNVYVLSQNRGDKSVLLVFWTTWCPYCRDELRELNKLHSKLIEDGVELLAVNVKERSMEVEKYVRNFRLTYKVLLDADAAVAKSYGVLGVPTFVLINKQGRIVFMDNYFPKSQYKELISK